MEFQTKRHINCPSDDVLLAYRRKELVGEEHNAVSLHLLFCDACLEYANLLPLNGEEGRQASSDRQDEPDRQVTVTPELAKAIERFRLRQQQHAQAPSKTWDDVKKGGGLKVGQIWRPKSGDILVPGDDRRYLVEQLDSRPHLVVVTEKDAGVVYFRNKEYQVIRVAPLTGSTDYAGAEDLVIPEDESPLGYSFMVETWNQQSMLRENLDSYVGAFESERHATILDTLNQLAETEKTDGSFSLEAVIMKGVYNDPIMRFRAKEYEDTSYLRLPVESLRLSFEELEQHSDARHLAASIGEEESSVVERATRREQRNRAPALPAEILAAKSEYPVWWSSIQTAQALHMTAQQHAQSDWPVQVEVGVLAEETQLSATLEFDWRGPCIVVRQIGELGDLTLVLRHAAQNIELAESRKAVLGTLDEFDLTDLSTREEIESHLKLRIAITCRKTQKT